MNIGNALENLLCLMKLVMLILCLAHWLACLAYVIATSVDDQTNTWITLYGIDNEDWYVKYITALYWRYHCIDSVALLRW
jgi:potassium voltage-gated channel Eag-related subfamily H protein 6/hyperpolarization activated cyclic nucleotide-gated potassium channel 2